MPWVGKAMDRKRNARIRRENAAKKPPPPTEANECGRCRRRMTHGERDICNGCRAQESDT